MVPRYVLFKTGTFDDAAVGLGFDVGDGETEGVAVDDGTVVLATEGCGVFGTCVDDTGGLVAAIPENNARCIGLFEENTPVPSNAPNRSAARAINTKRGKRSLDLSERRRVC
jgi:hypothetical protein